MLDGLAWPSHGSGGSGEPRDAWPRGQTILILNPTLPTVSFLVFIFPIGASGDFGVVFVFPVFI